VRILPGSTTQATFEWPKSFPVRLRPQQFDGDISSKRIEWTKVRPVSEQPGTSVVPSSSTSLSGFYDRNANESDSYV